MKTLTIGRDSSNSIVVKDPTMTISRHHADLNVNDDGSFTIVDKSTNGVFVNGKRIKPNVEFYVYPSDKINFGKVAILDWSKVKGNDVKKTRPGHLIGSFIGGVTDAQEKFHNIKLFLYILPSPVKRILSIVQKAEYPYPVSPYKFFSFFLAIYVFISFLFMKAEADIDDKLEIIIEWAFILSYSLGLILNSLITYYFFKTFTGLQKSRREYLHVSVLYSGFVMLLSAVALALQLVFGQSILMAIIALAFMIYSFGLWIKLNKFYWELSYLRTILIYLSATLIISIIVVLLIVGIVALAQLA